MTRIHLDNVSLSFPLLSAYDFSFRRKIIQAIMATHKIGLNKIARTRSAHEPKAAAVGGVIHAKQHRVQALSGISLDLVEGDRVGIIGTNGAGKSTLLKLLAGIYYPSAGSLKVEGKISTLFNLGIGIQDELNGLDNIRLCCALLNIPSNAIPHLIEDIVEFSELGEFIQLPVSTYSSGMKARLGFAISTAIKPDILLIDEVIGTGDQYFLAKAMARMNSVIDTAKVVVLASHADEIIQRLCNKVICLEKGQIQYFGAVNEVMQRYRNS